MKTKMRNVLVLCVLCAVAIANAELVTAIAEYQLGEADGGVLTTTVDSLGGIGDLTAVGAPTVGLSAAPGSTESRAFDGASVYDGGSFALTSDHVSLVAWVNPTVIDGFNFVASLNTGDNAGLGLLQVGGNWGILHMGVAGNFDGPAVVLDEWTKLELRYENGTSELYVNDIATGTTITNTAYAPSVLTIGGNPISGSYEGYFKGEIDNVSVSVPEPATMVLLGLGTLMLRRRKRA